MTKISKDNLLLWRYFFGGGLLVMHVFFLIFIFRVNSWELYVIYLIIVSVQFLFLRIWRYLFITNVYLSEDYKVIGIKNPKDEPIAFNCDKIIKSSTSAGITDIVINDNGTRLKFYFLANSEESLRHLPQVK